jgi:7-cyano-7-deazaguanine synthase
MDSTVLAHHLKYLDTEVFGLGFNYGQRHVRELEAAKAIADDLVIPFEIIDMSEALLFLTKAPSSQTNPHVDVPQGHYAADSMKATIVPNRNMVMLSIAVMYAQVQGCYSVAYAAHAGDHTIYPDCRPEFAHSMNSAITKSTDNQIWLEYPFINQSKADIVRVGTQLHVPFNLTYSCYEGQKLHCGKCGTCVERKEAFTHAEIVDPTEYHESFGRAE